MAERDQESWAEFHQQIDERLNAVRPERIGAAEREWREPVYGWARNHIPNETEIVHRFAQKEVDNRETAALKRGNRAIRDWAKGIVPLEWSFLGPLPIKVEELRIRLDVATPDDVDAAARELRHDAKQVFDEVTILADAMEDLALSARRNGLPIVRLLGDLPSRDGDDSPDVPDDDADPFGDE